MRRRNFSPNVESVEQRLSLSGLGGAGSAVSAAAGASRLSVELENTLISNFSAPNPAPHTGGSQQIIAILIG